MKISEALKFLEAAKYEYGDIDLCVFKPPVSIQAMGGYFSVDFTIITQEEIASINKINGVLYPPDNCRGVILIE